MRKLMLFVFKKAKRSAGTFISYNMICSILFICVNLCCFYFGTKTRVNNDVESIYFVPFHFLGFFFVMCICILSIFFHVFYQISNKCESNFSLSLLSRREVNLKILLSKFAKIIV